MNYHLVVGVKPEDVLSAGDAEQWFRNELDRFFRLAFLTDQSGAVPERFKAVAAAIERLGRLALAHPEMFTVYPRYQIRGAESQALANFYGQEKRHQGRFKALHNLLDIALTQRLHGLIRMGRGSDAVQQRYLMLPQRLRTDSAAGEPVPSMLSLGGGMPPGSEIPSIAALERRLRDRSETDYLEMVQRARLQPLNEQQLLAQEQVLVSTYFLKDPKRIWVRLPQRARRTLREMGYVVPEPWEVYEPVPNPSPSASMLRFVYLMQQTREVVEATEEERIPMAFDNMPIWKLGGLDGFEPPAQIRPSLRDPEGPDGIMPEATLLTLIMRARQARNSKAGPILDAMAAEFGKATVQWFLDGAPSIKLFETAMAFPKEWQGAMAFNRAASKKS